MAQDEIRNDYAFKLDTARNKMILMQLNFSEQINADEFHSRRHWWDVCNSRKYQWQGYNLQLSMVNHGVNSLNRAECMSSTETIS